METQDAHGHAAIYRELLTLGGFYGVDEHQLRSIVNHLRLDVYTEIVLKENGLEVVTGGERRDAVLQDLVAKLQPDDELARTFDALARRFPGMMRYVKFDLTSGGGVSLYSMLVEPWEEVFDFLAHIPSIRPALGELRSLISASPTCLILGMRRARDSGELMLKTYHLAERRSGEAFKPTLISHGLSAGAVLPDIKYYTAGITWEQARFDDRWSRIIDFAAPIFGNGYLLMAGERRDGRRAAEMKLYVFRRDSRETGYHMSPSYNFYRQEGYRLIALGRCRDAVRSLTNAIDYQNHDALAYNDRGYCFLQLGEYERAIEDCSMAIALDGAIAPNNLEVARRERSRYQGNASIAALQ